MQFSPGSGCGCKISPSELEKIIKKIDFNTNDKNLLVGNLTNDDAAVYSISKQKAIISTTDFFTPIVNNPFDYGYIAATNALSDVYAMGGKPFLAISILGWPLNLIPTDIAKNVLEGANKACIDAGVSLAGGHSIDIPVPVFGLSVNGIVNINNIKKNSTAKPDCNIYITKPVGIGLLTTALKKDLLEKRDLVNVLNVMKKFNNCGEIFGKQNYVCAMTDVTGFGIGGHLLEVCENSGISAEIDFDKIPLIENVKKYIDLKTIPGGTIRNFKSYGNKISGMNDFQKNIICDPQTSGGLLVIVEKEHNNNFLKLLSAKNIYATKIGATNKLSKFKSSNYLVIK